MPVIPTIKKEIDMTVYSNCYVRCQGSGCSKEAEGAETIREALEVAKEYYGFKRVKVQNGSYWDFCPECYKKFEKN